VVWRAAFATSESGLSKTELNGIMLRDQLSTRSELPSRPSGNAETVEATKQATDKFARILKTTRLASLVEAKNVNAFRDTLRYLLRLLQGQFELLFISYRYLLSPKQYDRTNTDNLDRYQLASVDDIEELWRLANYDVERNKQKALTSKVGTSDKVKMK
jgi:hypothetical protein